MKLELQRENEGIAFVRDVSYLPWFVWIYGISTIVGYLMPNPLFTYILNGEKILKNKVIQSEEFNKKESRRCNISVSKNHHQDSEKMLWSIVRSPMDDQSVI